MEQQAYIIEQIKKQGILPLFYHPDKELCLTITKALYDAGVRVIEFTNRGEQAFDNFSALVHARNGSMPGLLLAIGTIRTAEQAARFIEAGADLLISPVFDADVADIAYLHKKLWIPGCMTPTEVHVAEQAGCRLIKLFPGNVLGPGFVSAIKELFPDVDLMPTGGVEVSEENIGEWLAAGVCAVGLGSKLISRKLLADKDHEAVSAGAEKALSIIRKLRGE